MKQGEPLLLNDIPLSQLLNCHIVPTQRTLFGEKCFIKVIRTVKRIAFQGSGLVIGAQGTLCESSPFRR